MVIVRHHSEMHRSSNTGRLAHLALPNSLIIDHGTEQGTTQLPALDSPYLVYPVGEPTVQVPTPTPRTLVFLDATWSQARRMYRKISGLRGMPIVRLPHEATTVLRLRAAPTDGHVSTIEAIARALRLVEGEHAAAALEALFQVAVAKALATGRTLRSTT